MLPVDLCRVVFSHASRADDGPELALNRLELQVSALDRYKYPFPSHLIASFLSLYSPSHDAFVSIGQCDGPPFSFPLLTSNAKPR